MHRLFLLFIFILVAVSANENLAHTDYFYAQQFEDSNMEYHKHEDCEYNGSFSAVTQAKISFNVMQVWSDAQVPEGALFDIEICVLGENGIWGEWQSFAGVSDHIFFAENQKSYQYNVVSVPNAKGEKAQYSEVRISYDYIAHQQGERATGTLIGAVYDKNQGTGSRISGAVVTLSNGQKATTGSDGIFRFDISAGNYSYTISKSGYKSGSSSKYVPANETTWGSVGIEGSSSSPGKKLSGASWVQLFPPSRSIDDLDSSFRGNMTRFYNALKSAGASVYISNTLRPAQRAFLMHWSYRIAKEGYDPRNVPTKSGVDIEWWHGSTSASVAAARDMVNAYGIVYRPALTSNHIRGLAIDMNISWNGTLYIKDANGKTVSVGSPNSGSSNSTLWSVGRTYGVLKLDSDPPHWSSNGG